MEIRKSKYRWRIILLRSLAMLVYCVRMILSPIRTFRRKRRTAPPRRIAMFVSMELLGGGIVISAIAKLLKSVYPRARIYVVGEQHRSGKLESFFKEHSWVDELIICPVRGDSTFGEWVRFYRKLRTYNLDVCILSPNHSCANSVFLYLCGMPEIVGVYLPKTWPWHEKIENKFLDRRLTTEEMGDGYRLLTFPEAYGRMFTGRKDFKLAEMVPFIRFSDTLQTGEGPRVTFHAGGPAHRRWPVERFAELGRMLIQRYGATVYIIGGEEEQDLARQIKKSIDRVVPDGKVLNCCGCSLNETMNYVAHSQLYVGNNAGTLQIAVALGTPVVGVFQERDRWFSGPDAIGTEHCVVSRASADAVPVKEVWNAIEDRWADRLCASQAGRDVVA